MRSKLHSLTVFIWLQPVWKSGWQSIIDDRTAVQKFQWLNCSDFAYDKVLVSSFEVTKEKIHLILSLANSSGQSLLLELILEKQSLSLSIKRVVFPQLRSLPFQNLQQDGICTIEEHHTKLQYSRGADCVRIACSPVTHTTVKKEKKLQKLNLISSVFAEEWRL